MDGGKMIADGYPAEVMDSPELVRAFRIMRDGRNWTISEEA